MSESVGELFVLDTDILSLFEQGHPRVVAEVLQCPFTHLSFTVISLEEQLSGWYTLLRRCRTPEQIERAYGGLAATFTTLSRFPILDFPGEAIAKFEWLRSLKLGVRSPDLRIAAIALIHDATLVTRNTADFQRIPNLRIANWADD
jgi:tRNA(fMet)-specific endonuclease VapC